jgi:rubrerythrin
MTTFVGTQEKLEDAIAELIELDYAAAEAYQAAIDRLENSDYKQKITEFKEDHERHIQELSELLTKHNHEAPQPGNTAKQLLTTGKVALANMVGDNTILVALKSNEADTNTAYERMSEREDKWPEAQEIIEQGLQDERRHKEWLENTLSATLEH